MHRRAAILAAALLASCASRPPEPVAPPPMERPATLPPHTITIHTSPPDGIIDWNGDILGRAPVQLTIPPDVDRDHHFPKWPENGTALQVFRARWANGGMAAETFLSSSQLPREIAIIDRTPVYTPAIPEQKRKRLLNKIP